MADNGMEAPGTGRKAGPITALGVAALAKRADGKLHPLGGNLYLRGPSKPGGAAHLVVRYRLGGARRDAGLGRFDPRGKEGLSLAAARDAAAAMLVEVRAGRDPIAARAARQAEAVAEARQAEAVAKAPAVTFRRVAEEHIAAQERGWRNHKHGLQWSATLEAYAYPVLADLDPAAITTEHVLRVLSAIWATKPETASRVRGRVEAVLDAAKARGLRQGDNPARWKGGLALLLPPKGKVARVRHHPAVAIAEAPALVAALAKAPGQAARLCRFAMATACRSAEARAATWAEFDLGARLWSLPAGRTKNGKPHRVPLSDAALAVLAEVMPADAPPAPGALVFPGARGRPLSDMAATQLLRGLRRPDGTGWTDAAGATITLHGSARSTFADWALEVGGFPPHLVELALAHALGDATARAYMRGDGLDARRPLMAAWGAYLTGQQPEAVEAQGAEVIPLPVRRAG